MLQQPHWELYQKYVDAIEQNALAAARGAIGGGSMVQRLDFDLGLHRLAAAAGGGSSGDTICS